MRIKRFIVWLTAVWILSVLSCAHKPVEKAVGNTFQTGYHITGIAGQSFSQPSPNMVVNLVDKTTGLIISEMETDLSGRFHFKDLPPGVYVVTTGDIEKEVRVADEDQNIFLKIAVCECCPKY